MSVVVLEQQNSDGEICVWLSDTSYESGSEDYVDDGHISSSSDASVVGDVEMCHLSAAAVLQHRRVTRPVVSYRDEDFLELLLDDVQIENALLPLSDADSISSDI